MFKQILIAFILFQVSCVHYILNYQKEVFSGVSRKVFLNNTIRDVNFFPINGLRFRLSELKGKKAIVLVMREKGCPISEKYGPHLARMEIKYSRVGVQFIYNYVGQLDSLNNGRKDLKRFGFKAPYIIDTKQTIIDALSVQTTGEVLILTSERKLIYRGPLDDQYHLLKSALKVKNNYVSDILDAIISGKKFIPKEISAPGCIISRFETRKELFYEDVAPIISKKCSVCHNPSGSSLIDYVTYEDVAKRKNMFKYVIENDLMPPWGIDPMTGPWKNDRSLTLKEKAMLLKWIKDGCPKKMKDFKLLWVKKIRKIKPTNSYTIYLPEKVKIPVEGLNEYKYFIIPTSFKEDKWIKNVEFFVKPKVIHHMWLFIMDHSFPYYENISHINIRNYVIKGFATAGDPEKEKILKGKNNNKDIGYKLPKNHKIVLEIHYESVGHRVVDDYTHVTIIFHEKKPKHKIITHTIQKVKNINIPPNESNYQVKMSYKIKKTKLFQSIGPHMHLRGKASSVYVINSKGIKQKIFGIDPFLFNFQSSYKLKKPIKIERGSILECINWFDNSTSNPVNPDPGKYVHRGRFLEDEMSECYIEFLVPSDSNERSKWITL